MHPGAPADGQAARAHHRGRAGRADSSTACAAPTIPRSSRRCSTSSTREGCRGAAEFACGHGAVSRHNAIGLSARALRARPEYWHWSPMVCLDTRPAPGGCSHSDEHDRKRLHHRRVRSIALLVVALMAAICARAADAGDAAPAFALPTASGEIVSLEKLRGRVVYVDFWASWCGPCRRSFPWMNEMQQKYGARGLHRRRHQRRQEARRRAALPAADPGSVHDRLRPERARRRPRTA